MGRGAEPPAAIPGAAPRPSQLASSVAIADERPRATVADTVARRVPGRAKIKANSVLAARAAEEYLYVGPDLRRIVIVGAGLFATLIVLWLALAIFNLSGLY